MKIIMLDHKSNRSTMTTSHILFPKSVWRTCVNVVERNSNQHAHPTLCSFSVIAGQGIGWTHLQRIRKCKIQKLKHRTYVCTKHNHPPCKCFVPISEKLNVTCQPKPGSMKAGFYPTCCGYFFRVSIRPKSNCHPYKYT